MPTVRQLCAALLAVAATAHAQTDGAMTDGEVRKVDKAQAKVTLRHAAIPNLDMAPMTMVFKVADPKMLDSLKDGDRIRFRAERVNGTVTVTAIEGAAR